MKKCLILFVLLSTLSCSVKKAPEFVGVERIKLLEADGKTITLTADALFKNLNDVGGQIETDSIIVMIDNVKMARVQAESFDVPAREEFTIPLKVNIPTKDIFNENNLSSIFNSILSQKLKVNFKGDLKYKVLGFSRTYAVDRTEEVKIKL